MSSSSVGTNRRRRTKTTRTLPWTVQSSPEWEEGRRVDAAGGRRVRPTSRGGGGGEEEVGGLGSVRRGLRVLPHHRHKVLAFRRAPPRGAAWCGWGVVVIVGGGGNEDDHRRRSRVLCRGHGRLALAWVVVTLDLHLTASPFARPGESSKCKIICSCLTNCKKLVKLSFTDSCISCGETFAFFDKETPNAVDHCCSCGLDRQPLNWEMVHLDFQQGDDLVFIPK